jgi:cholesterol oxidase
MTAEADYDIVVVGSGFGGSVTAFRLTEKGYRVCVIEAGRRFDESTYPRTSWQLRRFFWAPRLGWLGLQRIHKLKDVIVLAGAGVGGGSLIYANTLYEPLDPFYDDPQWRHITDWRAELAPFYDQAKRMLGVTTNPTMTPADEVVKAVAEDMGAGETFHLTPVGVFFGSPGSAPGAEVPDPFFGGAGPSRRTCLECGACMTGCRHHAKNTLTKNYLYLAEQAGAVVMPERTVVAVRPRGGGGSGGDAGGYVVETERTGAWRSRRTRSSVTARQVVFAAGAYGTQRLLHQLKATGVLPGLSDRLGTLTRTNSESLVGAISWRRDVDFTRGVAITSSFHPDPDTHIEPVRYGKGSNVMGLLGTVLTDGPSEETGRMPRQVRWLGEMARHPLLALRSFWVRRWSERTIIGLVMQSVDNSLTVYAKRRLFGGVRLGTRQGHGDPNPSWIPAGNAFARQAAERIGGTAGGNLGDLVNAPMTAHFIGGCVIGDSPATGVIDPYHRVYGHPGLHVVDGAAVSANLGVNPSLTITAQAERAMAFWPNRGDADARPPLGAAYERVGYVSPRAPVVPGAAPGALRLPIVDVGQGQGQAGGAQMEKPGTSRKPSRR